MNHKKKWTVKMPMYERGFTRNFWEIKLLFSLTGREEDEG
jgi:hypothetical protein